MSGLLDDIINLAVEGKQPLPDLLRKCLLLGHELKNDQLKSWANQELNGYKSGNDVPEYRIVPALARGNFVGPFQTQYNRHLIPSIALEEKHRDLAERVYLIQSVSAYTEALAGTESSRSVLTFNWDPNMIVYYQDKLIQRFICHSAWQEIPLTGIAEMLDTIRNRTLNMALQLKDELGTSYADLHRIESKEVETKIQNIIVQNTGGNTTVAFGQANVDASGQGQTVIAVGDRGALDAVLTRAGLSKPELDSLTEAMAADGVTPGNKVANWINVNASKVLKGGVKVGTKIGSEILAAWIRQHYGLQ